MGMQRWGLVAGGDCTGGAAGDDPCGMYPGETGEFVKAADAQERERVLREALEKLLKACIRDCGLLQAPSVEAEQQARAALAQ